MAAENERVGDCSDEMEAVEEEESRQIDSKKILNFSNLFAAAELMDKLQTLPAPVKRRIKALKKLQLEATNVEAKFFEEVHDLECKYHKLYSPLYEQRFKVLTGAYEPNDEECQWPSDDEEELSKDLDNKAKIEEKKEETQAEPDVPVKGIPDFWLTVFKNVGPLSEMVQEHDEPILKHLVDIKTIFIEKPMGFVLEFHFESNEYFTNTVLTKEYDMKCVPDEDDPFSFEGPEIYKCRGCTISWNKGKNVTLKTVKKKQKHKSRGLVRMVTKTVQAESFFNFFSPPAVPDDINEDDVDEDLRNVLTTDFEIGHYLRERIVPRAVLYFTGEGLQDEDFDDEEEEEDEDEDDDEDEDSDNKDNSKIVNDKNCKQQ